jgi:hypothetical protein
MRAGIGGKGREAEKRGVCFSWVYQPCKDTHFHHFRKSVKIVCEKMKHYGLFGYSQGENTLNIL